MAKEVEWVKLQTDMFDNKKIKYLRTLPDGDRIALVWVMLILMAGKCNAGGMIHITELFFYTPESLAEELGIELNTVKFALGAFEQLGMIETNSKNQGVAIQLLNWDEYQAVDGLDKIREQTKKRVSDYRARRKELECNVTGNVTVTHPSISISNISNSSSLSLSSESNSNNNDNSNLNNIDNSNPNNITNNSNDNNTYKEIIDYLNSVLGTNYGYTSKSSKKKINARLKEGFTLEDFKIVIDKKSKEWGGTEFEAYLRPDTLFGGKFESYLNQRVIDKNKFKSSGIDWDSI